MAAPADNKKGSDDASGSLSTCPACGATNVRLKTVDGVSICDKCASKNFSSKVRKSIQEAFEKQQELLKKEAYSRRLTITRQAYANLAAGKQNEAIQLYEKYIDILNTRFKTTTPNLHPHLFDKKTEQAEILLATAVFWDLARTIDKTKGKDKEFRLYLNKYVEFSIGTKHMVLASETVRKYISTGKAVHKPEFDQAYTALRNSLPKCFISGVLYGPHSEEVAALQKFRDERLNKFYIGRLFIKIYYRFSPHAAILLLKAPTLAKAVEVPLNPIVKRITKRYQNF